jgi:hypothetical protein
MTTLRGRGFGSSQEETWQLVASAKRSLSIFSLQLLCKKNLPPRISTSIVARGLPQ